LGAAQNIPIILFFPLHLLLAMRCYDGGRWTARELVRMLLPYSVAGFLPAVVAMLSYRVFDTWNLLSNLGQADLSYLSIRKVLSVFISPMIGSLWYFPAAWVAAFLALCAGARRELLIIVVTVVAVATVSSTTANINSAQLSAPRYAAWFLVPLYVLPFYAGMFRKRLSMVVLWVGCLALMVSLAIVWWLGTYRCLKGDWRYLLSSPNRLRPHVAALYRWSHLHDDIEPIVESVRGQELRFPHDFRGIYVWNIGGGKSLWVVSKRAYQALRGIEVEFAADGAAGISTLSQLFLLEARDTRTFALHAVQGVPFDRHPYYGSYRILWVDAEVRSLRGQRELFVR